jgi:hypothetical protein
MNTTDRCEICQRNGKEYIMEGHEYNEKGEPISWTTNAVRCGYHNKDKHGYSFTRGHEVEESINMTIISHHIHNEIQN